MAIVSNAIIAWNTVYSGRVLDELRAAGELITTSEIEHISPLAHQHMRLRRVPALGHLVRGRAPAVRVTAGTGRRSRRSLTGLSTTGDFSVSRRIRKPGRPLCRSDASLPHTDPKGHTMPRLNLANADLGVTQLEAIIAPAQVLHCPVCGAHIVIP